MPEPIEPRDAMAIGQLLTPADICERARCTRRMACALMRRAGGWELNGQLRISEEGWQRWLEKKEMESTGMERPGGIGTLLVQAAKSRRDTAAQRRRNRAAGSQSASDLPKIRPTQPKRRKAVEPNLEGRRK